jgi:hypothetical protein
MPHGTAIGKYRVKPKPQPPPGPVRLDTSLTALLVAAMRDAVASVLRDRRRLADTSTVQLVELHDNLTLAAAVLRDPRRRADLLDRATVEDCLRPVVDVLAEGVPWPAAGVRMTDWTKADAKALRKQDPDRFTLETLGRMYRVHLDTISAWCVESNSDIRNAFAPPDARVTVPKHEYPRIYERCGTKGGGTGAGNRSREAR